MAYFFRTIGRFTGYVVRSHAFDKALSKTVNYIHSEMKLADVKLKLRLLRQKRTHHLKLLGKTVYRLYINDIEPLNDKNTQTITRVLREIDMEIEEVKEELKRRKQYEKQKRNSSNSGT